MVGTHLELCNFSKGFWNRELGIGFVRIGIDQIKNRLITNRNTNATAYTSLLCKCQTILTCSQKSTVQKLQTSNFKLTQNLNI